MTKELVEQINDGNNAFEQAYISKNDQDLITARNLRTEVKRSLRNAKADFIQTNLRNNSEDPKKFWEELNKLIKSKTTSPQINLKDDNNQLVLPNDTPNFINNFFSMIGPNLAQSFQNAQPPTNDLPHNLPLLNLPHISQSDLFKEVNKIKIYKSCGIRGLSSRLIKDAMLIMLPEFTHLLNLSLKSGTVPNDWKIATVIPIPKVNNPNNVSDLRPISLLALPGKYQIGTNALT